METVKRSEVAGRGGEGRGGREEQPAWRIFRARKEMILQDTAMADICHHASVKIHRIYNTQSKP